jgi:hypothetical protein
MWFISLDWQDPVLILGILGVVTAAITLASWLAINRLLTLKMP